MMTIARVGGADVRRGRRNALFKMMRKHSQCEANTEHDHEERLRDARDNGNPHYRSRDRSKEVYRNDGSHIASNHEQRIVIHVAP
jgi:hypothetical protein